MDPGLPYRRDDRAESLLSYVFLTLPCYIVSRNVYSITDGNEFSLTYSRDHILRISVFHFYYLPHYIV
jgi:hypothetical protein